MLVVYRDFDEVEPYRAAVAAVGVEPALVEANEGASLDGFDGLLLTGGCDVDPAIYGETAHPETEEPDAERDRVESRLLAEAAERDLPVLGICRGLQIMNVQAGGSLVQHLGKPEHVQRTPNRGAPAHEVEIAAGSKLHQIAGRDDWQVNSRHHQAIGRLGEGLRIGAVSRDGVVEAIERPDRRYFVAVQWHPENQAPTDAEQAKLFRSFADSL